VTCPLLNAESVQLVPGKYAEGARLRITRSGGDIITPIDYTLKVKPNLTG
jgi:ribosomal protein L18E